MASAVYQCLKRIPKTDYENAFRKWLKRLNLCVSHNGEFLKEIKRNNVSCAFSLVLIGHWTKLFKLPPYVAIFKIHYRNKYYI